MARRLIAVGRKGASTKTSHGSARLSCNKCQLTGHELPLAEVQHLIGVHDRLHHGGAPTAFAAIGGSR